MRATWRVMSAISMPQASGSSKRAAQRHVQRAIDDRRRAAPRRRPARSRRAGRAAHRTPACRWILHRASLCPRYSASLISVVSARAFRRLADRLLEGVADALERLVLGEHASRARRRARRGAPHRRTAAPRRPDRRSARRSEMCSSPFMRPRRAALRSPACSCARRRNGSALNT